MSNNYISVYKVCIYKYTYLLGHTIFQDNSQIKAGCNSDAVTFRTDSSHQKQTNNNKKSNSFSQLSD